MYLSIIFSFINLSHIKFNNSSFTLNIAQNDSEQSLLPSQFLCTILLVNGKSLLINELSDNFSEMADAIYDTMLSTHPYKARLLKKKISWNWFFKNIFSKWLHAARRVPILFESLNHVSSQPIQHYVFNVLYSPRHAHFSMGCVPQVGFNILILVLYALFEVHQFRL